jgi:hypothetical protein
VSTTVTAVCAFRFGVSNPKEKNGIVFSKKSRTLEKSRYSIHIDLVY